MRLPSVEFCVGLFVDVVPVVGWLVQCIDLRLFVDKVPVVGWLV